MSRKLTRRDFFKYGSAACLAAAMFPFVGCSGMRREQPNILFILTDQQHSFTINENEDNQFDTPAMDFIAQEGVNFTNSFCSTPQCSPSRASIMTGQYNHRTGVVANVGYSAGRAIPLNPAIPSIGNIFRSNGYQTIYYGKWHLGGDPKAHGWEDYKDANGNNLTRLGTSFLSSRPSKPFFLFLSYLNPHDVYYFKQQKEISKNIQDVRLPRSFNDDLTKKPEPQGESMQIYIDKNQFYDKADANIWKAYRQFYREKVKMVDTEIGIVLDALKEEGLIENTLIVFTSDHGDMDSAHHLAYKGPMMYEELIRVPLIISYPGHIPMGESRDQLVQNIDILPTLAEIAGIDLPHNPDGKSLMEILRGKNAAGRDYIVTEFYGRWECATPIRSIRTKDWKYNLYKKYGEELYNLRNDPIEVYNLANDETFKEKKEELHNKLQEWMKETDDYFNLMRVTDWSGRILDE